MESDIKNAFLKLRTGKSVGPDVIPIEVWKCIGEKGVVWLTKLFTKYLKNQ